MHYPVNVCFTHTFILSAFQISQNMWNSGTGNQEDRISRLHAASAYSQVSRVGSEKSSPTVIVLKRTREVFERPGLKMQLGETRNELSIDAAYLVRGWEKV